MSFCTQCGAKNVDSNNFCSACGAKINQDNYGNNNAFMQPPPVPGAYLADAVKYTNYFIYALAGLGVFSLLLGDIIGLVLCGAILAGVYFGALQDLKSGIIGNAEMALKICGGITLAIGVFILLQGGVLVAILDIAAAVPGYYAVKAIEKAKAGNQTM